MRSLDGDMVGSAPACCVVVLRGWWLFRVCIYRYHTVLKRSQSITRPQVITRPHSSTYYSDFFFCVMYEVRATQLWSMVFCCWFLTTCIGDWAAVLFSFGLLMAEDCLYFRGC